MTPGFPTVLMNVKQSSLPGFYLLKDESFCIAKILQNDKDQFGIIWARL